MGLTRLACVVLTQLVLLVSSERSPTSQTVRGEALQGLLGLQRLPTVRESGKQWQDSRFDIRMAPKYMLDLYEQYRDGRIQRERQVANTVRSIQAEIGLVRSESMFVFNLSAIWWNEKVLRAEIQLYKRRSRGAHPSDLYMTLYELGPTFIRKLDHRRVPAASYGWQSADVTSAIEACRYFTGFRLPRMLAIAFSTSKGDSYEDGVESVPVSSLVRRISRPYVIVYSNDTQNITADHIQPHVTAQDLTSSYVDPSTGTLERFSAFGRGGGGRRHRGKGTETATEPSIEEGATNEKEQTESSDPEDVNLPRPSAVPNQPKWFGDNKFFQYFASSKKAKHNRKENEVVDAARRRRRSILDNEIPEDPSEELVPASPAPVVVPDTHPDILEDRAESRRKHKKRPSRLGQLIPFPEDYRAPEGRKQRKNRRKNRRRQRQEGEEELSSLLKQDWDIEGVMSDKDKKARCGKRTLTVDFADIGWSQWVISPRSFQANYCAGTCDFPLSQRLKPSNHATIQSLIHAIGVSGREAVPAPCCVPDKMSAVTLLYFDESQNVVLKNYPEMSVESCSCR